MVDFYFDEFDVSDELDENDPGPSIPEPPEVATAFWRDTFTDADSTNISAHISDSGSGYTYQPLTSPDIVIEGNRARGNGTTAIALVNALPGVQEYDIDFVLERFSSLNNGRAGVVARASATEGQWYPFYYDDFNQRWTIGDGLQPIAWFDEVLDPGTYLCRAEVRDAVKRLLVFDDALQEYVEKVSTTHNEFVDGHVGLFFRGTMTASTGTHVDIGQAIPIREEIYSDTFEAADGTLIQNHTSDSGHTYTVVQGAADIINDRLRSISATRGIFVVDAEPPGSEYAVEFEFVYNSLLPDVTQVGVFARATGDPLNEAYYLNYTTQTSRWQIRKGIAEVSTLYDTFDEVLTPGNTYRCLVEIRDDFKRLSLWDGEEWQTRVQTTDNSLPNTGSFGILLTGDMAEDTGAHVSNIVAVELGEVDPEPPDPEAPEITQITAPESDEIHLTITPGENTDQHDLHRISGIANFDVDAGNLHAAGIGEVPPVPYIDTTSVQEETSYSYRVAGKFGGNIISVSQRVSITTPSGEIPTPGGTVDPSFRPNEPNGFQRWLEHDCTFVPGGGALSHAGYAGSALGGFYKPVDDTSSSNGKSIRIRYPSGFAAGSSPGRFFAWDAPNQSSATALKEWYISIWLMCEANTLDGGYEFHPGDNKTFYRGALWKQQGNALGFFGWKGGGQMIRTTYGGAQIGVRPCPKVVADFTHMNTSGLLVGDWIHVEVRESLSDPDTANGSVQVWLNNVQKVNRFNVQNQCSVGPDGNPATTGFFEFHWAPVWGGTGDFVKTRDDFMRIGHIYVSGIPQ